ncbi:MAG TPA: SGNH/GDSL hydrolase family protein [Ilumatobacteraceae bacterium]|nr:SGNH/GDSL hydrolase family protein [Ilumatobacteraceae bacterium]
MIVRTRLVALAASLAAPLGLLAITSTSTTAAPTIERIVTLGDSYSSGTGIHRNASDYDDHGPRAQTFAPSTRIGNSDCSRELDETPGPQLAATLGADSVFVACAGAVIADIANQVEAADIPDDGAGTVVTMTIGGNDLRTVRGENWPDTLVRCITSAGCDGSDKNQIANLEQMRSDLTAAYTAIGDQYPDISVRILGYPRLMQSDRWCEGVTGFGRGEADWVDDQVDRLNAMIATAVRSAADETGADLAFVSVVEQFDNHGACRFWQRDRYINDAVFGETLSRSMTAGGEVREHWDDGPLTISGASFHPSTKGYDAYLDALSASVSDLAVAIPSR